MIIHDHSQNLLLKWFHFVHAEKVEGKVYRDFDEIIARHMDFRDFFRKFEAWVGDPLDATKNMVVQAKIEYFGRHVVGSQRQQILNISEHSEISANFVDGSMKVMLISVTHTILSTLSFSFFTQDLWNFGEDWSCVTSQCISIRDEFRPGDSFTQVSRWFPYRVSGINTLLATLLIGNDRRAGPHHRQSEENHGASTFWPQCSTWRENRWSRAGERNVASLQPRRSNAELQALVARQTDWAWYALMGNWRAKSETRALGGLFGWLSFVWKSFSCAEASNFMVQNHWMEKCSKATQGCEAGAFFLMEPWRILLQIIHHAKSFLGIIYQCHFQRPFSRDHHPVVGMASKQLWTSLSFPHLSLQTKNGTLFWIFETGFFFKKQQKTTTKTRSGRWRPKILFKNVANMQILMPTNAGKKASGADCSWEWWWLSVPTLGVFGRFFCCKKRKDIYIYIYMHIRDRTKLLINIY